VTPDSRTLEAHHLVKRFHGHAAVSNVSFALRPGEILGYLGPNGSGKSLTLKMLTGLIDPTEGRVTYSGVDVTGGAVGVADLVVDLLPVHRHVRRRHDAEAHTVTPDAQHAHLDAITDHDGLVPPAGEDEHRVTIGR